MSFTGYRVNIPNCMLANMEVLIEKKEDGFKASCNSFPKCIGKGKTEKEALTKLSKSISEYISTMAHEAISSVIESDRYSEVILDTTKPEASQRRIFSFDSGNVPFSRTMFLKVDQKSTNQHDDQELQDIGQLFQSSDSSRLATTLADSDPVPKRISRLLQQAGEEGYVFGFPLSFN